MGDMGDYWRDVDSIMKPKKAEAKANRLNNAISNTSKQLKDHKIRFEVYESTGQFAIHSKKGIIDYWSSTGTWIHRKKKIRSKGLKSMFAFIDK